MKKCDPGDRREFGRAEADLIPWVAGIQTAGESSGSDAAALRRRGLGARQRVGGRTRREPSASDLLPPWAAAKTSKIASIYEIHEATRDSASAAWLIALRVMVRFSIFRAPSRHNFSNVAKRRCRENYGAAQAFAFRTSMPRAHRVPPGAKGSDLRRRGERMRASVSPSMRSHRRARIKPGLRGRGGRP